MIITKEIAYKNSKTNALANTLGLVYRGTRQVLIAFVGAESAQCLCLPGRICADRSRPFCADNMLS